MCRDCEIRVEHQVDDPADRMSVHLVGHRYAVEVDGVRQVGDHRQKIGNSQGGQQVIRRRYLNVKV